MSGPQVNEAATAKAWPGAELVTGDEVHAMLGVVMRLEKAGIPVRSYERANHHPYLTVRGHLIPQIAELLGIKFHGEVRASGTFNLSGVVIVGGIHVQIEAYDAVIESHPFA